MIIIKRLKFLITHPYPNFINNWISRRRQWKTVSRFALMHINNNKIRGGEGI